MWHAETECVTSGSKYRLLEHDDDFASWYTRLLADTGFEAFYWEHPDEDVIVFPYLGGDAMLIAPSPFSANDT